jgi:hypothetical protein
MIPYPHDTTDSVPADEPVTDPVIEPSAFLDRRRPSPRRGFVFAALLGALCLHGYALAILPGAMEIEVAQEQTADPNLINDEIGNDPDLPWNYNVDRIETVSVPLPLNPAESTAADGMR